MPIRYKDPEAGNLLRALKARRKPKEEDPRLNVLIAVGLILRDMQWTYDPGMELRVSRDVHADAVVYRVHRVLPDRDKLVFEASVPTRGPITYLQPVEARTVGALLAWAAGLVPVGDR